MSLTTYETEILKALLEGSRPHSGLYSYVAEHFESRSIFNMTVRGLAASGYVDMGDKRCLVLTELGARKLIRAGVVKNCRIRSKSA